MSTSHAADDATDRTAGPTSDAGPHAVEAVAEAAEHAVHEALDRALHGGGDAPDRLVEILGRAGLLAYGAVHLLDARYRRAY